MMVMAPMNQTIMLIFTGTQTPNNTGSDIPSDGTGQVFIETIQVTLRQIFYT